VTREGRVVPAEDVVRRDLAERDRQSQWGRLPAEFLLVDHEEDQQKQFLQTARHATRLGNGPVWRTILFEADTWTDASRFMTVFYWNPESPATIREACEIEKMAKRGDFMVLDTDHRQWGIEAVELAELSWRTRVLGSSVLLRQDPGRDEHLFSLWCALGTRLRCCHERIIETRSEDIGEICRRVANFRRWQDARCEELFARGLARPDHKAYVRRHLRSWPSPAR
jgi:hypothetical protein